MIRNVLLSPGEAMTCLPMLFADLSMLFAGAALGFFICAALRVSNDSDRP
jgi:hypothetical protein